MFASGFFAEELAVRIGWTLIHSLWQIALIGGLFWIMNRGLAQRSANLRHVVGCVAMLLMLAVPVCWLAFATSTIPVSRSIDLPSVSSERLHPIPKRELVGWPESLTTARNGEIEVKRTTSPAQTASGSENGPLAKWHGMPRFIATIWFIGVMLLSLRPALGLAHAGRLCKVGRADVPESVHALLCRVANSMNVGGVVQVAQSTLAQAPCVVGWIRPVILLPASAVTGLTAAELESILAHELAHIRRHDYLVNLVQLAIETLLFFHPVMWWVSQCVRREREYCCDDLAIQVCRDRTVLTDALLAVGEVSARPRLVLESDGTLLFERVERILGSDNVEQKCTAMSRQRSFVAAACALLLVVAIVSMRLANMNEVTRRGPSYQKETAMSERNENKQETSQSVSHDLPQLVEAVRSSDVDSVRTILEISPTLVHERIPGPDSGDTTLLHMLMPGDGRKDTPQHLEIAKLLLDHGADVNALGNAPNLATCRPLTVAAWGGHTKLMQLLIDRGAKLNGNPECSQKGPLYSAAGHGHTAAAELLVSLGAEYELSELVMGGLKDRVEKLLNENPDLVNQKSSNGATLLHAALETASGQTLIPSLLERGADPNLADSRGRSPLLMAIEQSIWRDQTDVIEQLSSYARQSVERTSQTIEPKDHPPSGDSSHNDIFTVAGLGDLNEIRKLLNESPELAKSAQADGTTPLFHAVISGNQQIVELLLQSGAAPSPRSDRFWCCLTPLHLALQTERDEISKLLVENGADVNAHGDCTNHWQPTPLHVASRWRGPKQLNLLLDHGADMYVGGDGNMLGWINDEETLKLLLDRGLNANHPETQHLFVHSASRGRLERVKQLIEQGTDPAAKNRDGKTARELALENGRTDVVRFLDGLDSQPSHVEEDDSKIKSSHRDLVQRWSDAINDHDYDRVLALLNEHPELGETRFFPREKLPGYHAATYDPSAFATMTNDLKLMEAFFKGGVTPNFGTCAESPEMAKLVIKYGKDTEGFKETLSNELFSASWFPNLEIQRILLEAGADPNVRKRNSGIRPLMYVSLRSKGEESLAIARQLIEHGADVNAKSYSGFDDERTRHDGYNHDVEHGHETPLHWAARKGNAPLVQLLSDHGADPDAKTTSIRTNERDDKGFYLFEAGGGETPRDWAYQGGDEATIRLLNGNDALDNIASAARAGLTDRVRTLIDAGKNVNAADSNGKSAIQYAIERRDAELCRVLTDGGVTWPETITTAIRMGIPSVVKSLLDSDPKLKEKTLRDPRVFFSKKFDLDSYHVESTRAIMNAKPESPLDLVLAGYIEDKDAAEAIIGARPDVISAAIADFPQAACYFVFDAVLLERVLDAGADIDARGTPHGYTPLQRAVWTSQVDSVQLLVKRGADLEIESHNHRWRTLDIPCYQSKRRVDYRLIKILLDAGADPNVEAHNGYTVLDALHHYAKELTDEEREQAKEWVRAAGGKTYKQLVQERSQASGDNPTGVSKLSTKSENVQRQFWEAVCGNDVETTRRLLEKDSSLASQDFRPEDDRNPHTDGFPLHRACAMGHAEVAKLLVSNGADVDARSPTVEQKELGMPLWWAVDRRDYVLANFLLDHGADVGAYAWANATMLDRLYEHAVEDGAPVEVVRRGFATYLGATDDAPVADDAPESVKLLARVLGLGGQPTFDSVVQAEYYSLVEELFQKCPEEPGTEHDDPQGNVFENLCNAASWFGRPKVMELAMDNCSHLHSPNHAKRAISRAIISHNRFGSVEDYYVLIEAQLRYLKEDGELSSVIAGGSFLPHHKVAKDYLWPDHYGYGDSKSSVESMIELSKLLISFGFEPNRVDANGMTPLTLAEERRIKSHAGLTEYIAFLKEIDAS